MIGTTLGHYRIVDKIGEGGMGVVYRANDERLDRDVAIKELPELFAQDPIRLERFELEAKALAALSHVNLAGIYGVEEQNGSKYLILEYVEGETLADRLDRGPLPLDEALELAVQIAAGVEAAHEAGIVHRDLKPANIKLTPEGKAKVLDFGLARADEPGSTTSSFGLDSATMTAAQRTPTIEGTIQALYLSLGGAYRIPSAGLSFGLSVNGVRQLIDTVRARNTTGMDHLVSLSFDFRCIIQAGADARDNDFFKHDIVVCLGLVILCKH